MSKRPLDLNSSTSKNLKLPKSKQTAPPDNADGLPLSFTLNEVVSGPHLVSLAKFYGSMANQNHPRMREGGEHQLRMSFYSKQYPFEDRAEGPIWTRKRVYKLTETSGGYRYYPDHLLQLPRLERDFVTPCSTNIDFANCHPTIIKSFLLSTGFMMEHDVSRFSNYVDKPSELRNELGTFLRTKEVSYTPGDLKQFFSAALYGMCPRKWCDDHGFTVDELPISVHEYLANIDIIRDYLARRDELQHNPTRECLNWNSLTPFEQFNKRLSYFCQREETIQFRFVVKALAQLGIPITMHLHDGCEIHWALSPEDEDTIKLLTTIIETANSLGKNPNLILRLRSKTEAIEHFSFLGEIRDPVVVQREEREKLAYHPERMKAKFESPETDGEGGLKIMHPFAYGVLSRTKFVREYVLVNRATLEAMYEDWECYVPLPPTKNPEDPPKYKKVKFVKWWLTNSPNTKQGIGMYPNKDCPDTILNLWTGFAVEHVYIFTFALFNVLLITLA